MCICVDTGKAAIPSVWYVFVLMQVKLTFLQFGIYVCVDTGKAAIPSVWYV